MDYYDYRKALRSFIKNNVNQDNITMLSGTVHIPTSAACAILEAFITHLAANENN